MRDAQRGKKQNLPEHGCSGRFFMIRARGAECRAAAAQCSESREGVARCSEGREGAAQCSESREGAALRRS